MSWCLMSMDRPWLESRDSSYIKSWFSPLYSLRMIAEITECLWQSQTPTVTGCYVSFQATISPIKGHWSLDECICWLPQRLVPTATPFVDRLEVQGSRLLPPLITSLSSVGTCIRKRRQRLSQLLIQAVRLSLSAKFVAKGRPQLAPKYADGGFHCSYFQNFWNHFSIDWILFL